MHSYNIIDKTWVPVIRQPGNPGPSSELSLLEVLMQAHRIEQIETGSPLETLALNRFLLAVILDALPELETVPGWKEAWQRGHFEAELVRSYLERHRDGFDLFHPERPFYQHVDPASPGISPTTRLFPEYASGHNPALFSHSMDLSPDPIAPAVAARGLICTQATALGGGVAKPFNFSHAPLVAGAVFWVRGKSLFESLLLNLPPDPRCRMGGRLDADKPAWGENCDFAAAKRPINGYLDYLTWQARRLKLVAGESENGETVVTGVRYNQGHKLEAADPPDDPGMAFRADEKRGLLALRMSANRALWRDSHIYMMSATTAHGHAPRLFEWLSGPQAQRLLGVNKFRGYEADVFGMVSDRAKLQLWRHERVSVYPSILADPERWGFLRDAITASEGMSRRLYRASQAFATRFRLNKPYGIRLGDIERRERDDFVKTLQVESRYWSALETPFYEYLQKVAGDEHSMLSNHLQEWTAGLKRTALRSLRHATESLTRDARSIRALAESETVLAFETLYPARKTA